MNIIKQVKVSIGIDLHFL